MSAEGVTLAIFKGEMPAEDVLNTCLLTHDTYIGVAVASPAKGGKAAYVNVAKLNTSELQDQLKQVTAMLERFKDRDRVLFFGTLEEGVHERYKQPFELVYNSDNKPIVVGFLEGVDDPCNHVETYIGVKLKRLAEECKYDVDKIEKAIDGDPILQKELGSEGDNLTLVYANGKHHFLHKPGLGGTDYDWGWITQDPTKLLAGEDDEPAKEAATEDEEDLAGAFGIPAPAPTPAETKPAPAATPAPAKPTAVPATVHPPGGSIEPGVKMEYPAKGMRKKQLMKWVYRRTSKPPTADECWDLYVQDKLCFPVAIPIIQNSPAKSLQELKTTTAPVAQVKDTAPKHIPEMQLKEGAKLPSRTEALLTPAQRDNVIKNFLPAAGTTLVDKEGNNLGADIANLKGFEGKLPDFAEQVGLPNLYATMHWSDDDLMKLGKTELQALVDFAMWWRHEAVKNQIELNKKRPAKVTTESTPKLSLAEKLAAKRKVA